MNKGGWMPTSFDFEIRSAFASSAAYVFSVICGEQEKPSPWPVGRN